MRHNSVGIFRKHIQLFLAALIISIYTELVQTHLLKVTAAPNPITSASSEQKSSNAIYLAQQGKKFYAEEKFTKAVKSWQMAA